RFLQRNARAMQGNLAVDAENFRLQGEDGTTLTPLLLNTEGPLPKGSDRAVTMVIPEQGLEAAMPRERKPWTPAGTFEPEPVKEARQVAGKHPGERNDEHVVLGARTPRF